MILLLRKGENTSGNSLVIKTENIVVKIIEEFIKEKK